MKPPKLKPAIEYSSIRNKVRIDPIKHSNFRDILKYREQFSFNVGCNFENEDHRLAINNEFLVILDQSDFSRTLLKVKLNNLKISYLVGEKADKFELVANNLERHFLLHKQQSRQFRALLSDKFKVKFTLANNLEPKSFDLCWFPSMKRVEVRVSKKGVYCLNPQYVFKFENSMFDFKRVDGKKVVRCSLGDRVFEVCSGTQTGLNFTKFVKYIQRWIAKVEPTETSSPKGVFNNEFLESHVPVSLPTPKLFKTPTLPTTPPKKIKQKDLDVEVAHESITIDSPVQRKRRSYTEEIVEPTKDDLDQLKASNFHPFTYKFWDNKSTDVQLEDIARLNPEVYINDAIIWFFLRLFMEQFVSRNAELAANFVLLDTFFYSSLRAGPAPGWVSKLQLLRKCVIMPINDAHHWVAAIVVNLNTESPVVIILDSLGSSARQYGRKVITALNNAFKAQGKTTINFKQFKILKADVPTQPNSTDCGVYLIHFIEQFLNNPEPLFSAIENSNGSILDIESEYWKPSEAWRKRIELKELLRVTSMGREISNTVVDDLDDLEVIEVESVRKRKFNIGEYRNKRQRSLESEGSPTKNNSLGGTKPMETNAYASPQVVVETTTDSVE